jgi:hypothetical protein
VVAYFDTLGVSNGGKRAVYLSEGAGKYAN